MTEYQSKHRRGSWWRGWPLHVAFALWVAAAGIGILLRSWH